MLRIEKDGACTGSILFLYLSTKATQGTKTIVAPVHKQAVSVITLYVKKCTKATDRSGMPIYGLVYSVLYRQVIFQTGFIEECFDLVSCTFKTFHCKAK